MEERRRLLWVFYGSLARTLSNATWVETAAELIDLGWEVSLAAADLPPGSDPRLRLVRLPKPDLYLGGFLLFHLGVFFHLLFHKNSYSVVLFNQHSVLFITPVALLQRLFARHPKYVLDIRSVPMVVSTSRSRRWGSLFNISQQLANRFADSITAITLPAAQAVAVPADRLSGIWPSGVKIESYRGACQERSWPGPADPVRFIYIGALHKDRNLFEFMEAVEQVRQEGGRVEFILIGRGTEAENIQEYIRSHNSSGIILKPSVPHQLIPAELGQAHVGVLPFPDDLKYQISSPVKLFEYMAAGMPILATRILCHTSVLADGITFWAEAASPAALASAIRQVLEQRQQLPAMGKLAEKEAPAWSWAEAARKLSAALEKTLAARG